MKINYSLLLIIIFIASCQNHKQEYVCTPCDLSCDTLVFSNPGVCTNCKMKLISKSELKELNKTVKVNGLEIDYDFSNSELSKKESEITEIIERGFESYQKIFDGNPRDTLDLEYNKFNVLVRQNSNPGGEADPKKIILNWSENTILGFSNWKTILLHELFHLWNAESFRYKSSKEHWFNEGFTEFYTYQTATKLGLISNEEMLSIAIFPVGSYLGTQRTDGLTMRKAGIDDQSKFDNYFLVYHGGWVTAMVLDYDIRTKTNGEKSLDNLMKWLYDNFNRTEKLYDLSDIIEGIRITTGLEYTEFFTKYVDGQDTIHVSNYFDLGKALWDYKWTSKDKSKYKHLYKTFGIIE